MDTKDNTLLISLNREVGELTKTIVIHTENQNEFNKDLLDKLDVFALRVQSLENTRLSTSAALKVAGIVGGIVGAAFTTVINLFISWHSRWV